MKKRGERKKGLRERVETISWTVNGVYDGGVFGKRQGQGWFEFEE